MQVILLLLTCNKRERRDERRQVRADTPNLEDSQTGEREQGLAVQHWQVVVAQVPEHQVNNIFFMKF